MEQSKKWDRLKVQFVKCFTTESLHAHLVEQGFRTVADILRTKRVDGLRFVDLNENDLRSWSFTPLQKSKILECMQSILSTDGGRPLQPLKFKRFPLEKHETHHSPEASKKSIPSYPNGYVPMDGVKNNSHSPSSKPSPPISKKPNINKDDNDLRPFPKPHLKSNEPQSTWYTNSTDRGCGPLNVNKFQSSFPKSWNKTPVDHRRMVGKGHQMNYESIDRPDAFKMTLRKGSLPPTLPILQSKDAHLTKSHSDTNLYEIPEIYQSPPMPQDSEAVYEAPPVLLAPQYASPHKNSKALLSPLLILPQMPEVDKPKEWKNLPRPPPFDNNIDEEHLNASKELLNDSLLCQEIEDDIDENTLNLNDCPYYRNTDRKGAMALLNSLPTLTDGSFVLRKSYSGKSFLVLTVFHKRKFYNISIYRDSDEMFFCKGGSKGSKGDEVKFYTLEDFAKHYKHYPLKVKSQDGVVINILLTESLPHYVF